MRKYTHIDKDGIRWRMEGTRPISEIADKIMESVFGDDKKKTTKKNKKSERYKKSK